MGDIKTTESVLLNLRILVKDNPNLEIAVSELLSKFYCSVAQNNSHNGLRAVICTTDVIQICTQLPPSTAALNCMNHLIGEQGLESPQVAILAPWLRVILESSEDVAALTSVLKFLKSRNVLAVNFLEGLFHPNDSFSLQRLEKESKIKNNEVFLAILQCLEAVLDCPSEINFTETQLEVCARVANIISLNLYGLQTIDSPAAYCNILLVSIKLLTKISTHCQNYAREHTSELFGLAKAYMHFSIEGKSKAPQKILPAQQPIYDSGEERDLPNDSKPTPNCGGKQMKARKPRSVVKRSQHLELVPRLSANDEIGNSSNFVIRTSDSDTSDSEVFSCLDQQTRLRHSRVRLMSIALLGAVVRAQERRILYGYWHALFPSGIEECRDDLLLVALRDPNSRCRNMALQLAAQLILGSKNFLHQAESSKDKIPAAFLPFAQNLGHMLLAIYASLSEILTTESSIPVLINGLKCIAVLVQATPFHQLEPNFVKQVVQRVRPYLRHRDSSVQVSALMVMEFLMATTELTAEIAKSVGLPPTKKQPISAICQEQDISGLLGMEAAEELGDNEFVTEQYCGPRPAKAINEEAYDATSSWLLALALENLDVPKGAKVPATVQIESLQLLSAMSRHFPLPCLDRIADVLRLTLNDQLLDVRLCAARCLDSCSYQIACRISGADDEHIGICEQFWLELLPGIMILISREQGQLPALRVLLCDALSNIGVYMFERLQNKTRINLFSFLSGISSDAAEDMSVRTAAVRALGVFVLFPSLRGYLVFVENAAELMLRLVPDSNLIVRIKAFWSIGNVSDALISNSSERISIDLLTRLITAASKACTDNDKVRCNAVRILGNLLRLLTESDLDNSQLRLLVSRSVENLTECIRNVGNAKVKWNACYAVGNIVRNPALFTIAKKFSDFKWHEPVYATLCSVIVRHPNFKVRINATTAIIHITKRSYFGSHFERFCISLLEAVEQSSNLDHFSEYNHRDNLQDQLCLALCHIISIASEEDFIMLKKHLVLRLEIVRSTWERVTNRMVPEKSAPLFSCSVMLLERIKEKSSLSVDQRNAIDFIAHTFQVE